ncbi:hypothetical protein D3C78_1429340 [compost metagenome]
MSPIKVITNDIPSTVKRIRNRILALKLSLGCVNLAVSFSAIRPITTGSIIITMTQMIGNTLRIDKATSPLNSPTAKMIFNEDINRTVSVQIIAPYNAPSLPFLGNLVSRFMMFFLSKLSVIVSQ